MTSSSTILRDRLRMLVGEAGGNKAFAEKVGLSLSTLNNYLRGRGEPTISKILVIANACEVSIDWLAGRSYERNAIYGINNSGIDMERLAKIIAAIDEWKTASGLDLPPKKIADLTIGMYNKLHSNDRVEDGLAKAIDE